MNRQRKVVICLIMFILTLAINAMGAFGLINNMSQADVSKKYPTLITPAGFTFSIWSVIYILLFISLIVLYLKRDDIDYVDLIDKIYIPFIASSLFNILWIIIFSFEFIGLSVFFIFAILISLLIILYLMRRVKINHPLFEISFGIYAGWLYIASFVNLSAYLESIQFNKFGLSDGIFYIILLILLVIIVYILKYIHGNAVFNLPIAWAFFGISKNGSALENKLMIPVLFGLIVVLIAMSGIEFYKNHKRIMSKIL